jgi:archaemetzincin
MKKFLIPLFIFMSSLSYSQPVKTIYIQPLGNVNKEVINTVKTSIESFYKYKCLVKTPVPLSQDILTKSKTRYEASKILKKFNSTKNLLILTEIDIAYVNGNIPEWGIFGLGYRPGTTCIVSTYRLKKKVSHIDFLDRLVKTSLHEIGHNLGLKHCSNNKKCLMQDAKGSAKCFKDEKVWLCDKCQKIIKWK